MSGAGETTCGNTRCGHHFAPRFQDEDAPVVPLTTLELPFAYVEHGETKSALVKVVLCSACVKKLMYKRTKEKSQTGSATPREKDDHADGPRSNDRDVRKDIDSGDQPRPKKRAAEEPQGGESERKNRRSKKRVRVESRSRSRSRERRKEDKSVGKGSRSPHSNVERGKATR